MPYCDTIADSERLQIDNLAINISVLDLSVLIQEIPTASHS